MKSMVPFIILAAFSIGASAQEFRDPDLQSLVDAERAFIRMAKEKNIRDAFLHFLADDAVTASPGKGPRKGKEHLRSQAPNETYLHWSPVFTDIAASGDFGYNTGPWEFRPDKTDKKAVAFGQFVSMWKKNADGHWQVVIDIGISHEEPKMPTSLTTSDFPLKGGSMQPADPQILFEIEKQFIAEYEKSGNKAHRDLLSPEARFFRPGRLPLTTGVDIEKFLLSDPSRVDYEFMGGDVARSGDLAYVYGRATVTADNAQQSHGSYMRFYKRADGKNWKIVLDLLTN